jgi:hypothetical protein
MPAAPVRAPLSWQYTLLLPRWVRAISSPPLGIGTPWEKSSVATKFRIWRARSSLILTSSVGPSAPWFQDRLWSWPSRLSSPLASLCLSLYLTRSCSVKPSCAVTKSRTQEPRHRNLYTPLAEPVPRRALPVQQGASLMAVKLFVGGLSYSTSTESLRDAFAAVGTVESATIVTDRDTGRSRGFGFVEMATGEDADQAVSRLNGSSLDGRTIKVEKATGAGPGGGGGRGPRR